MFCDNSDSEETLSLDDEDINFLAEDYEYAKKNMASDEMLEFTIDSTSGLHYSPPPDSKLTNILTDKHCSALPPLSPDSTFKWQNLTLKSQAAIAARQ